MAVGRRCRRNNWPKAAAPARVDGVDDGGRRARCIGYVSITTANGSGGDGGVNEDARAFLSTTPRPRPPRSANVNL